MLDRKSKLARVLGMARVIVGPPVLIALAWLESVRVRGPLTVALARPAPALTTAISDALVVGALTSVIFWMIASVAGSKRPVLLHFILPVAASQLPLAGLALICGRRILGSTATRALLENGESFMQSPWTILGSLGQVAVGVILLTIVAITWLYTGYRKASRLEGARLYVSLIAAIVASELVCRLWFLWAG